MAGFRYKHPELRESRTRTPQTQLIGRTRSSCRRPFSAPQAQLKASMDSSPAPSLR